MDRSCLDFGVRAKNHLFLGWGSFVLVFVMVVEIELVLDVGRK